MPDHFENNSRTETSTPVLAVAPHARDRMIEALQFRSIDALQFRSGDQRVGGWDRGITAGTNVKSYQRGDIGIIEINGVLLAHDDMTAYFMGLTTYESVAAELGNMISTPGVNGVVISIDSPGGMVSGVSELSDAIYSARSELPLGIKAHVMGEASSAAYWLGSSADELVLNPTAQVGSIGAVLGVYKSNNERSRTIEFVSSVSPLKRANPETDAGRNAYQGTVDSVGNVFVGTVARNRGVSVDTVAADFGRGGELVGQQAVDAGMADRIGSLEMVISEMRSAAGGSNSTEVKIMGVKTDKNISADNPAPAPAPAITENDVQASAAAAQQAERDRTAGIISALQGTGLEAKASDYIASGVTVAEVNAEIVAHLKAVKPQAPEHNGTLDAMRQESAAAAGVEGSAGEKNEQATIDAAAKAQVMAAWADGAQNAIARGGHKRVEA